MTLIKKIKDKKVNFEFNKEYIKVLADKIASNDALFITNAFKEIHPADAADIIENLNENDREKLIKLNSFKIDPKKAGKDLSILIECFRIIGIILQPFIPNASKKILDILNINNIKFFLILIFIFYKTSSTEKGFWNGDEVYPARIY